MTARRRWIARWTFRQALDTYEAARQRFNHREEQYFDLCPGLPDALTGDGLLGHLLSWSHWSAADVRRMLKDPERHEALAIANAYEAAVRRAKRTTNFRAVEAAIMPPSTPSAMSAGCSSLRLRGRSKASPSRRA